MGDTANPYLVNPRWSVAERVATTYRRRHPADVLSVGVHGSLAHGDDTDTSGVEMIVLTYHQSRHPPRPVSRRVDGVLVRAEVATADAYLQDAQTMRPTWPLTADRYVTARPVHDPEGWLRKIKDAHLGRLAQTRPPEFTGLAREAWVSAAAAHARAVRLAEWYDTDAALLLLGEVRLHAAMVTGLLSRTYFRNSGDAVRKTGLAGADMSELAGILRHLAEELTSRGRPIDADPDSIFD